MEPRRAWSATVTTLLGVCMLAGCGGRETPDGASGSMEDTAAATARDETGARAPSDSPMQESRSPMEDSAAPGDTGPASPSGRDTAGATPDTARGVRDTTASVRDTTASARDTVTVGRFWVRVRATADPDTVARRHGVRPLNVIREPTKGFYAALSRAQLAALEADSLVRSIAREIHGGDTTTGPQIRGVPVRDTAREPG